MKAYLVSKILKTLWSTSGKLGPCLRVWEVHDERWVYFWYPSDPENLLVMLYTWQSGDCSKQEPYNGDFRAAMQAIKAKMIVLPGKTDLYFAWVLWHIRNSKAYWFRTDRKILRSKWQIWKMALESVLHFPVFGTIGLGKFITHFTACCPVSNRGLNYWMFQVV